MFRNPGLILAAGVLLLPWGFFAVEASEVPMRKCCDIMSPTPTATTSINPGALIPTSPGFPGPNAKNTVAILNCLLAKQLCQDDASCSSIQQIIPKVCGVEQVGCATTTVVKCQAALRTLQGFQFFRPTCLCREPSIDPECNQFRDSLFDHPCIYVLKKDLDPYPVQSLPTCNHALSVCQSEHECIRLFEDFKTQCKVRDGACKMESRVRCLEAWREMKNTPLLGCICPNNSMKRRCDRIFTIIHNNPCIGTDEEMEKRGFPEDHSAMSTKPFPLASTCHYVLNACQRDRDCHSALSPVLKHCDETNCHKIPCRKALHNLYANISIEWRMEIAFCLCKKSDNLKDDCMIAQEKLHPYCAHKSEGSMPSCQTSAHICKEDRNCRIRLENYEQACAVDSLTKKCSGTTHNCRMGVLGILGTELRDFCDCRGTDFAQLYECVGWQRILWYNPCLLQSQLDYYYSRSEVLPAELLRFGNINFPLNNFSKVIHANDLGSTQNFVPGIANTKAINNGLKENIHSSTIETAKTPKTTDKTTLNTTLTILTTKIGTTPFLKTTTPTTTTTPPTTTTTTTTTPSTTTLPPKFCLVERQHQPAQIILEGNAKRLYKDYEPECSEVCHCQVSEHLECRTICVKRAACKSEFAFYNHAAPAYQAYRGRCICYSGRFICVRPPPGQYSLPQGIFLFLGYSEVDETLLKPHNNLSVIDIASTLQQLLSQMYNRTTCTLEIYNITGENLIMAAHIIRPVNATLRYSEIAALGKECSDQLQDLSEKINSRDMEVHSHLLLSILKLAEVEVKLPEVVEDSSALTAPRIWPIFCTISCLLSFSTLS